MIEAFFVRFKSKRDGYCRLTPYHVIALGINQDGTVKDITQIVKTFRADVPYPTSKDHEGICEIDMQLEVPATEMAETTNSLPGCVVSGKYYSDFCKPLYRIRGDNFTVSTVWANGPGDEEVYTMTFNVSRAQSRFPMNAGGRTYYFNLNS